MPGHDINFQAIAGTLDYPRRTEVPLLQLSDLISGTFAAMAILGALAQRKRAVYIDVPIVQSLLSWMILPVSAYLATGKPPEEGHSLIFGSTPYYNLYRTSDGKYMAVAAIEEEFWHNLVVALGVSEHEHDRFGTAREQNELTAALRRVFATKTRDEWTRLLAEDTCATPVLSIDEAINSDWAKEASMLVQVNGNGTVLNNPLRAVPSMRGLAFTRAPSLGEDTDAVMKSLGYSKAEVEALKTKGVLE
jgi:crotonobetainyl-CoA:carnitine CoA-transferase CaiB-like acyl-CoA transferase